MSLGTLRGGIPAFFIFIFLVVFPVHAEEGLVAYWKFDEGSGTTAADSSGNGNDGTITGATWTTSSAWGDYALSFDGADDYVNVSDDNSLDLDSEFTLLAWVKSREIGVSQAIITKQNPGVETGDADNYQFMLDADGTIRLFFEDGAHINYAYYSDATVTQDTWTLVAAVFDGPNDEVRLYVNNTEKKYTGVTVVPDINTFAVFIGVFGKDQVVYTTAPNWFNGTIDEVRIYNRTLTATEIKNLFTCNNYCVQPLTSL